jgi:hypothetical protein
MYVIAKKRSSQVSSQVSNSLFQKTTWKIHFVTGVRKRSAKKIEEYKHNLVLHPMYKNVDNGNIYRHLM